MELLNGTENRIRELDKNVWGYCINMFSRFFNNATAAAANLLKSKQEIEIINFTNELNLIKENCKTTLEELKTYLDNEKNNLDKEKDYINNFEEFYNIFLNKWINNRPSNLSNSIYYEFSDLQKEFKPLQEDFINRYLNDFATRLNGVVLKTNKLKEGFLYYTFGEKYELKKLGVFVSKTHNKSDEKYVVNYNIFKLLDKENTEEIDYYDSHKYYIEIKEPEPVKLENIELIVPSGGKPRRTRRHKNKKRRSSKQQKSKK